MMQENRSFDHYLGSLNGVRGFSDPRAVKLPGGNSVFQQPVVAGTPTPYVLPYHPTAPNLGLQFIEDLEHDWDTTHIAWNEGNWNRWVPAKSPLTMVHLDRTDIPFHYALADAFTVCDAYHASLLGPTDPNRYHMFTGWVGNDGKGGGPVVDNAEAGYDWVTFPEILQDAGITWRVGPISRPIWITTPPKTASPWWSRTRANCAPPSRSRMSIRARRRPTCSPAGRSPAPSFP